MKIKFFNAIKKGDLERVRELIRETPTLIHEKQKGLGPILTAAYYQKPEIAEFLAEKTINLTVFEAAALGKTNQLARHLARNPELVNAYSEDGFQPLGLACFFGHLEAAEYLVKAGALINSPSKNNINAAPLQSAAAAGYVDIAMMLMKYGADPNVREQNGYTPLHAAAQNGNVKMIHALLFNGADMTISASDGKTPVDMANEAGHKEAASLFKQEITRRFRPLRPKLNGS